MLTLKAIILSLLVSSLYSTLALSSPSAYEMLENFNFPKGILPQGVKSYTLNQDGSFEIELGNDCDLKVDGGYLLKYKKKITGRIQHGVIKELSGVSVKAFWWFGINEVLRSDDTLYFYVGPFSASFRVSDFEDCPWCRGFNRQNEVADAIKMTFDS